MLEGLAQYFLSVVKTSSSDEEAASLILTKLKELSQSNFDACILAVKNKEKEFGEVAIRVNRITKEILVAIDKSRQGD